MSEPKKPRRGTRLQAWVGFLTSLILLGLLIGGTVLALIRIGLWIWR